jgi:hypothetical protein
MNFQHLAHSIQAALADDQCALCGTPIPGWLDEIACPHWFLAHGKVGLHPAKLAAVFEAFEPLPVVDYLRLVAARGRGPAGRPACRDWEDGEGRHIQMDWRLRSWQFSFPAGLPSHGAIRSFVLTTFYRDALVAQGRIELLDGATRVRFTPLVEQGRPVGAR